MTGDAISHEGLKVEIGLPSTVMLVIGGMVGVGVFVNPAVVARSLHAPALMLAAWAAGGLIALAGALVYGELAARMPATGGEYVYLRETFGAPAAFLFGWTLLLVVHTGGMAAVAIVFARNLDLLAGGRLPEGAAAVATLAGLAAINCLGVRSGNWTQSALGVVKVAAIVALVVAGFAVAGRAPPARAAAAPAAPDTLKAFGAAMIPVVFSYGGWQTTNFVAGEMRNPARNLARALAAGVLAVTGLYLAVNLACLAALGPAGLAATLTPASEVLQRAVGPAGARLAAAAIGLSALAFLSQSTLTGPRVLFAMARDGLFFRALASVSPATRVPALAIVVQAAWASVLALTGGYEQILSFVIAMNVLFFGLTAAGLFVLRRREARGGARHQGYRTPGHPWTTGLFVAACALIVASSFWSYPVNSLIGYAILVLGIAPYLYFRRLRAAASAPPA